MEDGATSQQQQQHRNSKPHGISSNIRIRSNTRNRDMCIIIVDCCSTYMLRDGRYRDGYIGNYLQEHMHTETQQRH